MKPIGIFAPERRVIEFLEKKLLPILAVLALGVGILIRIPLFDFVSMDYHYFLAPWYEQIALEGIGEQVGNQLCFRPEKAVSKGEFTAMLLESLGVSPEQQASYTDLAQDAPQWLRPYLAAAVRSGLLTGLTENFDADAPITGQEAAMMLENALDVKDAFALDAGQTLTRADCAVLFYQVSITDAPGKAVFNSQMD